MTFVMVQEERDRELEAHFADPPPSRRTSWSAADLMAADFPEPRWAIPGIIAEGVTLLAGPPKLGKSWLGLNMAAAVGSGGKALGKVDVGQGDALYLALEDPPRRLKERLAVVLEGGPVPPGLHFETAWPLLHDGGIDALDERIASLPAMRLVVVDVFAKVRGSVSEKEDRYTADYRAMSRLKDLADARCVAVIVVHHTRKAGAEDFLDTVSGTHGLAGAADTVAVLTRSRGSADATLHVTGRDVVEMKYPLALHGGRWTLLDGSAQDYELGDTRRRILAAVRDFGPQTPKQVAGVIAIDHELAKKTCKRMADDRQLDVNRGTYSIPVSHVPVSLLDDDEGRRDDGDTPSQGDDE